MILFYNKNKVGVDCFDQMARLYLTRSASRRWPLTVWGNILDIAAINARVIFMKSTGTQISRRNSLLKLIKELTAKQTTMQSRESSDRPICSVNSTKKRRDAVYMVARMQQYHCACFVISQNVENVRKMAPGSYM